MVIRKTNESKIVGQSHIKKATHSAELSTLSHDLMMEEEAAMIMGALSTLTPPQVSDLTTTILSHTLLQHHRLSSLLSSPSSFSLALHHLHSLSLTQKALLIAKHLVSSLHHLTRHFHPATPQPNSSTTIKHRDLDAVLLLFLLCDVHQDNPEILKTPRSEWREILSERYSASMLMHSGIGVHYGGVLLPYVEVVARCLRFVTVVGGRTENKGREVAASPAAVVALPTVQVTGGGWECVICREEMREGRDACELPCEHSFHWMCVLPWLKKRNTCPCCRFRLPTDDVFGEIERLRSALVKMGGRGSLSGVKD